MKQMTEEELRKKVSEARKLGISDTAIEQQIRTSVKAGKYSLPTPKSGSIPSIDVPTEKGWLGLPKQDFKGGFLGNITTDTINTVKGLGGLVSLPGKLMSGELNLPDVAGSVVKGIATDYGELAQQPLQTAYNKPISTALNVIPLLSPLKRLAKLGRAGKAVTEISTAGKVAENVSTAGKLGTETVSGLLESGKKVSPAARQYASIFTVPTKRAKTLQPLATSQKLVDYGIVGKNLDELKDINNTVNTVINATKKEILSTATKEISLEKVSTILKDNLTKSLSIPKKEINRITGMLVSKTATGKEIFKLAPADAFSLQQQIEKMGHEYLSHNSYLTGNMHDLQLGNALLKTAEEIGNKLDDTFKLGDISQFKNSEYLAYLEKVSPKLAQEYINAKTFKELRTLQSPFVKSEQMIDLTEQASNSVGSKVARNLGEAAYNVARPAIEGVSNKIMPKIQTGVAGAMETPVGETIGRLPAVGGAIIKNAPYEAMVGRNLETPQNLPVVSNETNGNSSSGFDLKGLMEQPTDQTTQKTGLGGFTKEDFDKMYEADLANTGGKNFAKIKLLEDRSIVKTKPLTGQSLRNAQRADITKRQLEKLTNIITENPDQVIQGGIWGALGARRYRGLLYSIIDNIGYLSTGAAYNKEQRQSYEWMMPQIGDTPEEITQKLQDVKDMLDTYKTGEPTDEKTVDYGSLGGIGE